MKYIIPLLIFIFSSSDLFAVNIFTRIQKRLVNFIQRFHASPSHNAEPPVTHQELEATDELLAVNENPVDGMLNSLEAMDCLYDADIDHGIAPLDESKQGEAIAPHVNQFGIYFAKFFNSNYEGYIKPLLISQWLQILPKKEIREKLRIALENLNNIGRDDEEAFQVALNAFLEIIKSIHSAFPQRRRGTFDHREQTAVIVDLTQSIL